MSNRVDISQVTNDVNVATSDNAISISSDILNTTVEVTQPVTSIVHVLTGPAGPAGPIGPIGPTGAGIFAETTLGSGIFFTTSSLELSGSLVVQNNYPNAFLVRNMSGEPILTVTQSGYIIIATQSAELTSTAPVGAIYFTSNSFQKIHK